LTASDAALAQALREESARLVTAMHRLFGDFDIAEEAVQTAVVEAVTAWRRAGVPERPGAWLHVAARRNGLDLLRRDERQARAYRRSVGGADSVEDQAVGTVGTVGMVGMVDRGGDDRLALLFACCHPALASEARLALTLRAVAGLTTAQISRAFLVSEPTLAQRIVRAKRKIQATGIALQVPAEDELPSRLDDVLTVVALMYNEAYVSTTGVTQDRDLADDAVWLAGVIATSLPRHAETWGLAALLTLQHARSRARFDGDGNLVLLRSQDRSRWDRDAIASAETMLERAAALRDSGRWQLQAAIAACHASAPSWEETDWLQIVTLYDVLVARDPSPVARLNRAVAVAELGRREQALADVDGLAEQLAGYHLFHATRAELLRALGRETEAHAADQTALGLTANTAERRLLQTRLRRHGLVDGS
jgi:RNA polymerase sigma factor (sigma-70 family)